MGDGGVGECTGQAGAVAHRRLQLTAVAGHMLHRVQPGNLVTRGRSRSKRGEEDSEEHHGSVEQTRVRATTWPQKKANFLINET